MNKFLLALVIFGGISNRVYGESKLLHSGPLRVESYDVKLTVDQCNKDQEHVCEVLLPVKSEVLVGILMNGEVLHSLTSMGSNINITKQGSEVYLTMYPLTGYRRQVASTMRQLIEKSPGTQSDFIKLDFILR